MADAVRRALADAVGSAPAALTVLAAEPGRAVVRADAGGHGPLVVKVAAASEVRGRGGDFERSAAAGALAAAAGVPAPEVLAARSAGPAPFGWLVQRAAEGTAWHGLHPRLRDDEVRMVHRQLAEVVLALRTVRLEGYGDLDGGGHPAGLGLRTALHRRIDRLAPDPRDREALHHLLDREPDLARDTGATLCHDDLHAANVLLARDGDRWRVTAVLDWDEAWAGPAESDVARMAFWDGMTGPGFWEVYRAAVPEAPGEPRRALLHQLLWCLEYEVPTERHRADTARLRTALGLPAG